MATRTSSRPAPTGANQLFADRSSFVRSKKVPELMAADIRKRIVKGDLKEGDSLPPEAELMQQYSVSRPTLREALRILESESLIEVRRGGTGGAVVKRPMLDTTARHFALILQDRGATVEDVYKARTAIEPQAMADAARAATKTEIAHIKRMLDEADQQVGSPASYANTTAALREYIVSLGSNITASLLTRLLDEILSRHSARMGEEKGKAWVSLQRKSQRSFRKLVGFLEQHDADGARDFWRAHLEEAGVYLLDEKSGTTIVDLFE
jgi:GntR family transcriptional regulator, transcriptional repressor for pyruvate dehydrogenase complex